MGGKPERARASAAGAAGAAGEPSRKPRLADIDAQIAALEARVAARDGAGSSDSDDDGSGSTGTDGNGSDDDSESSESGRTSDDGSSSDGSGSSSSGGGSSSSSSSSDDSDDSDGDSGAGEAIPSLPRHLLPEANDYKLNKRKRKRLEREAREAAERGSEGEDDERERLGAAALPRPGRNVIDGGGAAALVGGLTEVKCGICGLTFKVWAPEAATSARARTRMRATARVSTPLARPAADAPPPPRAHIRATTRMHDRAGKRRVPGTSQQRGAPRGGQGGDGCRGGRHYDARGA